MKYYVYETVPTFITTPFDGSDNEYIIEHTLVYDFITATDSIDKVLKKIGVYPYPKQLKWNGGIMIIRVLTPGPGICSIGKLITICCSELVATKFEMQVLKNNLKRKKENNLFNFNTMIDFNIYHNSKEKEKRLLYTKYSK